MSQTVELFTDGACRGNPGPGGWGTLIRYQQHEKVLYGGEIATTNNRMELMAVIRGLEALTRPCTVVVTSDSKYLLQGIQEWLPNWKKRQWLTADRKPVKNSDLWRRLDELTQPHQIRWQWVKGHSGHAENEQADALANRAIDELLQR